MLTTRSWLAGYSLRTPLVLVRARRHGAGAPSARERTAPLPLPVAGNGSRADQKSVVPLTCSRSWSSERDELDRLAQAHVVGEYRPDAVLFHEREPRVAFYLVV